MYSHLNIAQSVCQKMKFYYRYPELSPSSPYGLLARHFEFEEGSSSLVGKSVSLPPPSGGGAGGSHGRASGACPRAAHTQQQFQPAPPRSMVDRILVVPPLSGIFVLLERSRGSAYITCPSAGLRKQLPHNFHRLSPDDVLSWSRLA